jgi:OmpA-OmpF porin, OOP family
MVVAVILLFGGATVWALSPARSSLSLDVRFEKSQTTVAKGERAKIVKVVERIRSEGWCSFEVAIVIGHADPSEASLNTAHALSIARAEGAAKILNKNGVPSERVYVEGKGATQPIEGAASARVEIEFIGGPKSVNCPRPSTLK